jgi:hypothetical protein
MKLALLGAAMAMMPAVADAALVGNLGRGTGDFLTLTSAGLNGGSVATLAGGSIYNQDLPFADDPAGFIFGGNFLAAGPLAGQPATLTFTQPVTYLSFLWGSPDTYNRFSLRTNVTTYNFDVASLGFAVRDGNQNFSQYVQFAASAGETILGATFTNNPATDAFEVANFSISPVPEPATWAMMLVGFGMVGATARYRRRHTKLTFA